MLLAVSRYLVAARTLIFALVCTSTAIAKKVINDTKSYGRAAFSTPSLIERNNDLNLLDAACPALQHNPELATFVKYKHALKIAILQAGLLPIPDIFPNVKKIGNICHFMVISTLLSPSLMMLYNK